MAGFKEKVLEDLLDSLAKGSLQNPDIITKCELTSSVELKKYFTPEETTESGAYPAKADSVSWPPPDGEDGDPAKAADVEYEDEDVEKSKARSKKHRKWLLGAEKIHGSDYMRGVKHLNSSPHSGTHSPVDYTQYDEGDVEGMTNWAHNHGKQGNKIHISRDEKSVQLSAWQPNVSNFYGER